MVSTASLLATVLALGGEPIYTPPRPVSARVVQAAAVSEGDPAAPPPGYSPPSFGPNGYGPPGYGPPGYGPPACGFPGHGSHCACQSAPRGPGAGYPPYGGPVLPILREWLFRECDMHQHNAYILLEPDTYYFRPYNVVHIPQHQKMVASWGGDIRHPYANELFEQVYQAWEEQKAREEILPETSGVPLDETLPLPEGAQPSPDTEGAEAPVSPPPTPAPNDSGQARPQSGQPGAFEQSQSELDFIIPIDQ